MANLKDSLKWQNQIMANQLKIIESLQPSINIAQNIVSNIQPTINIAAQINANFEAMRESVKFPNFQIAQHYGKTFNNIANQINIIYSEPISNALRNLKLLQNSYNDFQIDVPEIKFIEITSSFNKFIDDIEISETTIETKDNFVETKESISEPLSVSFDQWLNRIFIIINILLSLSNWIESKDAHYQEEYLKVINEINSNLEQIILLESQE